MKKKFLPKAAAVGIAAVLTVGMAGTVFADTCWTNPTSPVDVTTDTDANGTLYSSEVTVAGHRAAQTLVEILGLNNKAAQNMAGNKDGVTDGDADQLDPEYNWKGSKKSTEGGGTKQALFNTAVEAGNNCKILGVFGSDLNSNPDPYYYNYYYDLYALTTGQTRVADSQKILMIGTTSLSPNLADTIDNSADYPNSPAMAGISCSVYSQADILVGSEATGSGKGTNQTYVNYIKDIRSSLGSSVYSTYNPIVFQYKYNDVYQEGESLQRLATTVDSITTTKGAIDTDQINSYKGTETRYGDPLITANNFQLYVKGLSAYVAEQLAEQNIAKKTVVVIDPCSNTKGQDGDSRMPGTDWFRAYSNQTRDGLANRTRGAEAVENVTTNLLETYKSDATKVANLGDCESKAPKTGYAITESVVKEADVIIIQGAQSTYGVMTEAEFKAYMETNFGWTDADFANKTVIAENPQCVYGMTCNSSESAMAYGFYMGYIYPEILNPVDACGFFYDVCLHITDEDAVQSFMDCNVAPYVTALGLDGELSDDWYETIRADIEEGVAYFNSLDATAQSEFYFVSRVATGSDVQTGIFTDTYNEKEVNSVLSLNVTKWNNPTGAALAGATCNAATAKRASIAGTSLTDEELADVTYTYISEDPSIATVDANGVITGVANGDTYVLVTATYGDLVEYVYEEPVHIGPCDVQYVAADGTKTTISGDTIAAFLDDAETIENKGTTYKMISLDDIFDAAGIEAPACSIKFVASDGFNTTLSVSDGLYLLTADNGASYRSYSKTIAQFNNTSVTGIVNLIAFNHNFEKSAGYTCTNEVATSDGTAACGVARPNQTLKVTTATKTVKATAVAKAKKVVAPLTVKTNAQTTITYKATKTNKYLTLNTKTGKVTVKKGTPAGKYTMKVKVTAKATSDYNAATKTVTVTIKVK